MNTSYHNDARSLVEELKGYFYDNIKVEWNEPMAARFVHWGKRTGFSESAIKSDFYNALIQRHGDATDMGLNRNRQGMKFALSSTVSLAKEKLLARKETLNKNTKEEQKMEEIKEGNTRGLRRNPAIDEKLNRYLEKNPGIVEYYDAFQKEELIRKLCLQRMNKEEYQQKQNAMAEQYLNDNPEVKAKLEQKTQEAVRRQVISSARREMKHNPGMNISL